MSRKKIVAANWKMNLDLLEGEMLVKTLLDGLEKEINCEVILAPPYTHIQSVKALVTGVQEVSVAAQNCHPASSGAFTGEISIPILKSLGVGSCIIGHSERRQLFQESNEFLKAKVDAALSGRLVPIFCCGEPLAIRESGKQNVYVSTQLEESLFHLDAEAFRDIVIAYEPIWAIGTGVTASPEQAQEMHAHIRSQVAGRYNKDVANAVRILYGGSIKADNAESLFSQKDVDGGLVGGASLEAAGFLQIIKAAGK